MKREVMAYFVVGAITTLINMVAYYCFCSLFGLSNLISNGIAWVLAVVFAYFANDRLVFVETKGGGFSKELEKIKRFFGARIFSLFVDEAGMFFLVEVLFLNNMFSKVAINVIIILLNYILSKCFVFKKSKVGITDGNRTEI